MQTLTRRFSIVCLITAIFGMGMASLVADNAHSQANRHYDAGCRIAQTYTC